MKKFKAYSAGYFSPFIWNFCDPSDWTAGEAAVKGTFPGCLNGLDTGSAGAFSKIHIK